MWSVDPRDIAAKPRRFGISGFMRARNEGEFIGAAIQSHVSHLDELVIVLNNCDDNTAEICLTFRDMYPDKIKIYDYQPEVVPVGTEEAKKLSFDAPEAFSNQSNYAMLQTNYQILLKVDADHLAVNPRFGNICKYVRKKLKKKQKYPIYGINVCMFDGCLGVNNFYNFGTEYPRKDDQSCEVHKVGPLPFTSGENFFFYVDEATYFSVEPQEGLEHMHLPDFDRHHYASFTYAFFHLKGLKKNKGFYWEKSPSRSLRSEWTKNVENLSLDNISSFTEMRYHNPVYFRGADISRDLRAAGLQDVPLYKSNLDSTRALSMRERLAGLYYRFAYP